MSISSPEAYCSFRKVIDFRNEVYVNHLLSTFYINEELFLCGKDSSTWLPFFMMRCCDVSFLHYPYVTKSISLLRLGAI